MNEGTTYSADVVVKAREDGRKKERVRIYTILASPEAQARRGPSTRMAFDTELSSDEAIRILETLPTDAKAPTADSAFLRAMALVKNPPIGRGAFSDDQDIAPTCRSASDIYESRRKDTEKARANASVPNAA